MPNVDRRQNDTISDTMDFLIPSVEYRMEALFQQCEQAERKVDPVLSKSHFPQWGVLEMLGELKVLYEQTMKLNEYRRIMMASLMTLLEEIRSTGCLKDHRLRSDVADLMTTRGRLTDEVFDIMLQMD